MAEKLSSLFDLDLLLIVVTSEMFSIFTESQRYCCCSTNWLWQISAVSASTGFRACQGGQ